MGELSREATKRRWLGLGWMVALVLVLRLGSLWSTGPAGAQTAPSTTTTSTSAPTLGGGNGVHHFFAVHGYATSLSGCEDQAPDNPNLRTGRDVTGAMIGHLWLEGGALHANAANTEASSDYDGTGVLRRDGSFHLDYPRKGPSTLRAFDGKIGAPNPDNLDAPITAATWTTPYPNGTSPCLVHWVSIKGHVNLKHGGFGVRFHPKPGPKPQPTTTTSTSTPTSTSTSTTTTTSPQPNVQVSSVSFIALDVLRDREGLPAQPIKKFTPCNDTGQTEWQDCKPAFPDGTSEKSWPIALGRGSSLQISSATFAVRGDAPIENATVTATADLGNGTTLTFGPQPLTQSGSTLETSGKMTSSGTLPDVVTYFDPLTITWKINAGDRIYDAGATRHPVYVLLNQPNGDTEPYLTLVDLTARGSDGESRADGVVRTTYSAFRNRAIHRRELDPASGTVTRHGGKRTLLQYWEQWALLHQLQKKYKCGESFDTERILATRVGRCGAWARFLRDTLALQGIASEVKAVDDRALFKEFPKGPPGADVMLVKSWDFAKPTGDAPFRYVTEVKVPDKGAAKFGAKEEVKDKDGLAGQGIAAVTNPPGWFRVGDHAIVVYNNKIWDPSYGTGPFNTIRDWAKASLDGYATITRRANTITIRAHKGIS